MLASDQGQVVEVGVQAAREACWQHTTADTRCDYWYEDAGTYEDDASAVSRAMQILRCWPLPVQRVRALRKLKSMIAVEVGNVVFILYQTDLSQHLV